MEVLTRNEDINILSHKNFALRTAYMMYHIIRFPSDLIEDCISQAYLGLLEAAKNYNSAFNVEFTTYASLIMRGRILDYLRANSPVQNKVYKRQRKQEELEQATTLNKKNLENVTKKILKEEILDFEVQKAKENEVEKNVSELTTPVPQKEKKPTHRRRKLISKKDDKVEPEGNLEKREFIFRIWSTLNSFQRNLFYLHYIEDKTFREIGETIGCSKSWVAKNIERTCRKVQKEFINEYYAN